MKKYGVYVSYVTSGYVEVEAENEEEAEEMAYEAVRQGDIETEGEFNEPHYKFEIEELTES